MTHPHHSRALWLLAALLPSSCGDRNDDDDSSPSEDTDIEVAAPEVLTVDEFFELFGASYCEKNNVCLEAAGLEPIDCEMATADDDDSPPESRPPGSEGGWVRGALAIVVFLVTVWLYARP